MELEEDGSNARPVSWDILHKHTEAKEKSRLETGVSPFVYYLLIKQLPVIIS